MDGLLDVEVALLGRARLALVLQRLDLRPLAPDDDAGAGGEDGDARPVGRALDVDPRDSRVVERRLDEAADLVVLVQQVRVPLGGAPARAPRPGGPQPEPDRMRLLAPGYLLTPRAAAAAAAVASLRPMVTRLDRG